MSPVKISEALAANLPIIINQNIGDLDEHLLKFDIGFSININDIKSIKNSISKINNLSNKEYHRDEAFKIYDISTAIKKYSNLYYQL
jgi:glycosyltransferase involved in cell wall biosynthesis